MSEISSALSTDEVSALMDELGEAGVGAVAAGDDARPFALGGESMRPVARLSGLERMGEKLARGLREMIEPLAHAKIQVGAAPLETICFGDWRRSLPDFTSISHYRLRTLKGGMLIALEPAFIAAMVDAFYGGGGAIGAARPAGEFTPSEDRLLTRLSDSLIALLTEVWADVVPIQPLLAGRETNPAYASLVRDDEQVVVQQFALKPGNGRGTTIAIVYPLATLRPIETELAAKVHDDHGSADVEWRHRLAAALENVRLPVRSVLARPEITVAQLMTLKAGDVIPITLSPNVPLIVGAYRLAAGTIGEQEGRAALMIEQVGRGTDK